MTLSLINRSPEPNEIGAPVDGDIFLEIISTTNPPDASDTEVFVNGVLAFSNGVFQTSFDGPNSSSVIFLTNVLRITIDPTFSFSSEEVVSVQVVTTTTPVDDTLDETYSFTAADTSAPTIASVLAIDTDLLLVTFNETMTATNASNLDDALNPANYTFTAQPDANIPAVPVVATGVVARTGDVAFEVTTDIELSPGITYLLTMSGAQDANGNPFETPSNTALFSAFLPPVPDGRRFNLFNKYPRMNRNEDVSNTLFRFAGCLQDIIVLLLNDIDRWTDILDPDTAPEEFVDAMLCDMGNPFRFDLSLVDKRRLLRVLVNIYKEKGIPIGIENAVRLLLGIEVTVEPCTINGWVLGESELGEDTILGPGELFALLSFQIVSPVTLTATETNRITKIAQFMKPVNTHLKTIIEP